jgi:hypothetical protein
VGHDFGVVEIGDGVGESAQVLTHHPVTVGHGIRIRAFLVGHARQRNLPQRVASPVHRDPQLTFEFSSIVDADDVRMEEGRSHASRLNQSIFVLLDRLATNLDAKRGETGAYKWDGARQAGPPNGAGLHL